MFKHRRYPFWPAYILSGIAIIAIFAARSAITPLLGHSAIFLVYVPAIAIVAIAGGVFPAIAVVALSTAFALLQIAYENSAMSAELYFQAVLNTIGGLAIVFVAENWRRVYSKLHNSLRSTHALLQKTQTSETQFKFQSNQLTLALEAGRLGTWQYDIETESLSGNSAFWASLGVAATAQNTRGIQSVILPEDFKALLSALKQGSVAPDHTIDMDIRARFPDRRIRSINLRGRLEKGEATNCIVGVSADISERRQAEVVQAISAQDKILIEELVHRIKNLFPVILSIISLTAKHYDDVTRYQLALIERLRVLEATHSLLAQDVNRTASISKLVFLELVLFKDDDRVSCKGPPVLLMEGTAESFSMIVHELATNSVKYGALGRSQGKLEVRWKLEDDDGGPLVFEWIESNTNPAKEPRRPGYGSSIIGASGPPLIGDCAKLEFTPDGMLYTLTIPRGKISKKPIMKRRRRGGGFHGISA
jgi:two-component sensor histidine kinase/PAS domain-containing protein